MSRRVKQFRRALATKARNARFDQFARRCANAGMSVPARYDLSAISIAILRLHYPSKKIAETMYQLRPVLFLRNKP